MSTHAAPAEAAERLTSARPRAAAALGLGGAAASVFAGWLVWTSPLISHSQAAGVAKGLVTACYIGVGAYISSLRPTSRLGPLIAGAGLIFSVTALSAIDRSLPFTVGRVTLAALVVYFAFVFVSFPRGRLATPLERRFVAGAAASTAVVWTVVLVFADRLPHGGPVSDCTTSCPGNALQLVETPHKLTTALGLVAGLLTTLIVAGVIVILARKAGSETLVRRRALAPLLYASIVFAATYGTYSVISETISPPGLGLRVAGLLGALSVPVALLFGQARGRLIATAALWHEMAHMAPQKVTPRWLQEFLRETLGDASFQLAVWSEEHNGYIDSEGASFELPAPTPLRSLTMIARRGLPSLALVHDVALDEDLEVVRGLGVTAATLLENATLVGDLQASRARIVDSVEQERHRLERDLHDGAQQRLTTIQLKLAVASEEAEQASLRAELEELAVEAAAAAGELRAVAHGIYPPLLHDAGVAPALRSVAGRAAIPVRMIDRGIGRAPARVELAVYYCALEALQNAAKHAGPETQAVVTLARTSDELVFEIRDDGVGFDPTDHGDGLGLISMRDRIGAVGGRLEVRSAPGAGTSVRGTVPADDGP